MPEEPRKSQLLNARVRPRTAVSLGVSPNFLRAPLLVTYQNSTNSLSSTFVPIINKDLEGKCVLTSDAAKAWLGRFVPCLVLGQWE